MEEEILKEWMVTDEDRKDIEEKIFDSTVHGMDGIDDEWSQAETKEVDEETVMMRKMMDEG